MSAKFFTAFHTKDSIMNTVSPLRTSMFKSTATLFAAVSLGTLSFAAQANPVQTYCSKLTPNAFNKMTNALATAVAATDAALIASGSTTDSYPSSEIRVAQQHWQTLLDYIAGLPVEWRVPYITPSNVALGIDATNISVTEQLVHSRYWTSALAYNYAVTNQPLAEMFLDARKKVLVAMDHMDRLGDLGVRCAVGQSYPSALLP
jgi:hypothetical protein